MRKPWHYRPDMGSHEYELDTEVDDWEYNGLSNSMAWFSDTFWPKACKEPDHWTTKVVLYLWADCACCLFFRGALLGLATGVVLGASLGAAL
jgi:hypothetical protein